MRYNYCSGCLIKHTGLFFSELDGERGEGRGLLKIWVNALNSMEDGLHLMLKRRGCS